MKGALVASLVLLVACSDSGTGPNEGPVASAVEAASGQAQNGVVGETAPEAVTVLVTDSSGSPLANVAVGWVVTAGAGSVAGGTSSDNNGIAQAVWTLGTVAGDNTIEARVGSLPAIEFTATAAPGAATELSTNVDSIMLDLPTDTLRLVAALQDQYGNTIPTGDVVWASSDSGVLSVDETGLVQVVRGGLATITATSGTFATTVPAEVDLPLFSVPMVDLDLLVDFYVFGEPLSDVHDNVAYELTTDDDSMAVRSVTSGRVEVVYYQEDTDDYEMFVRYSDSWLVIYDHLVAPSVEVGDDVQPGDTIGGVARFGSYQVGMELRPMGRVELQVNYQGGRQPELAWCPALFGTADFNAAHDAALARTEPDKSATCLKDTAQP